MQLQRDRGLGWAWLACLLVLLPACEEFQQGDGSGTDTVPDTGVVDPPDTVQPAPPAPPDTIRVDSTSIRPDSVAPHIDTAEVVPSDTEATYWEERQDTLNPGNYMVVMDRLPWGGWEAPDTVPGRIVPFALVYWEGQQMVGCSGEMCPRYGFPATAQDEVTWERQPVPEEPEPEPQPAELSSLEAELVATGSEWATWRLDWDVEDGPFVVFACCRDGGGSYPGAPYRAPDTVAASPAHLEQARFQEDANVQLCVTQVPTGTEACVTVPVPALEPPQEPILDTVPDPVPGVDVVRTTGGFLARWTDVVGETAYIIQQRCTRDGVDTWCRVWDGEANTTEAAVDQQHDGSALEPGASYGYRIRACNNYGCANLQFSAGAAA